MYIKNSSLQSYLNLFLKIIMENVFIVVCLYTMSNLTLVFFMEEQQCLYSNLSSQLYGFCPSCSNVGKLGGPINL